MPDNETLALYRGIVARQRKAAEKAVKPVPPPPEETPPGEVPPPPEETPPGEVPPPPEETPPGEVPAKPASKDRKGSAKGK